MTEHIGGGGEGGKVFTYVARVRSEHFTLNVVIEGAIFLSVFPQKTESIMIPKVFELNKCVMAVPKEQSMIFYQLKH